MLGSLLNAHVCDAGLDLAKLSYNAISCGTTTHNSHAQVTHYNDDCYVEYVTRVNGLDVILHDSCRTLFDRVLVWCGFVLIRREEPIR